MKALTSLRKRLTTILSSTKSSSKAGRGTTVVTLTGHEGLDTDLAATIAMLDGPLNSTHTDHRWTIGGGLDQIRWHEVIEQVMVLATENPFQGVTLRAVEGDRALTVRYNLGILTLIPEGFDNRHLVTHLLEDSWVQPAQDDAEELTWVMSAELTEHLQGTYGRTGTVVGMLGDEDVRLVHRP